MCTTSAAVLFLAGLCLGTGPALAEAGGNRTRSGPSGASAASRSFTSEAPESATCEGGSGTRILPRHTRPIPKPVPPPPALEAPDASCSWILVPLGFGLVWLLLPRTARNRRLLVLAVGLASCGKGGTVTGPDATEPACQNVQWSVIAYAGPCCQPDNPFGPTHSFIVQVGPEHLKAGSYSNIPFTVPAGKYLGISSILYSSKLFYFSDLDAHGSYFHIGLTPYGAEMRDQQLISVPSTAPSPQWRPPFRFEPGSTIYMDFSNGAPFDQWMTANVTGYLADDPNFRGCNFQAVVPGQNAIH